jgi:hypothetical protein
MGRVHAHAQREASMAVNLIKAILLFARNLLSRVIDVPNRFMGLARKASKGSEFCCVGFLFVFGTSCFCVAVVDRAWS